MKQCFILLLSFLFLQSIRAQPFPYTFTVDQAEYVPLTNAIAATDGVWDDLDIQTPLGFPFQLWGQSTSTLLWYGNLTAYNVAGLPGVSNTPFLIAYGADLIDRGFQSGISQSPIFYKTEGQPGNRVFKMQWANAGFFSDDANSAFTNLQVWLYEGSNNIELRFGPTQANNPDLFDFSGPLIGFMDQYNLNTDLFQNLHYLVGPAQNPVVEHITSTQIDTVFYMLYSVPGNGLVYRFSSGVSATQNPQLSDSGVHIYPTLANDAIWIAIDDQTTLLQKDLHYTIFDALGKTLRNGQVTGTLERIELTNMAGGLYYVNLYTPAGLVGTQKVWKQ